MSSYPLSRRSFLTLSAMLPWAWQARAFTSIPVGLELYSVRNELKRDPEATVRAVDIAELSTRSYAAAHTGAPMFSVQMIVNVPSRLHIGVLREEFMDFCDHLNLDAIFEPVKN